MPHICHLHSLHSPLPRSPTPGSRLGVRAITLSSGPREAPASQQAGEEDASGGFLPTDACPRWMLAISVAQIPPGQGPQDRLPREGGEERLRGPAAGGQFLASGARQRFYPSPLLTHFLSLSQPLHFIDLRASSGMIRVH